MTLDLRLAFIGGLVLAALFLVFRTVRCGGLSWPVTDLLEAVIVGITPLPLPGALEMIWKALQADPLPMLDSAENRAALTLGGALLTSALVFTTIAELKRALRPANT